MLVRVLCLPPFLLLLLLLPAPTVGSPPSSIIVPEYTFGFSTALLPTVRQQRSPSQVSDVKFTVAYRYVKDLAVNISEAVLVNSSYKGTPYDYRPLYNMVHQYVNVSEEVTPFLGINSTWESLCTAICDNCMKITWIKSVTCNALVRNNPYEPGVVHGTTVSAGALPLVDVTAFTQVPTRSP